MGKILKKQSYSLIKNIAFSLASCGSGCSSCTTSECTQTTPCGDVTITVDTTAGYEGRKASYTANRVAQGG